MQKPKFFKIKIASLFIVFLMMGCSNNFNNNVGQTTVSKWQGDKKSAISITYDDGIITQFTVARPIMNKLDLPATYFILYDMTPEKGQLIISESL